MQGDDCRSVRNTGRFRRGAYVDRWSQSKPFASPASVPWVLARCRRLTGRLRWRPWPDLGVFVCNSPALRPTAAADSQRRATIGEWPLPFFRVSFRRSSRAPRASSDRRSLRFSCSPTDPFDLVLFERGHETPHPLTRWADQEVGQEADHVAGLLKLSGSTLQSIAARQSKIEGLLRTRRGHCGT